MSKIDVQSSIQRANFISWMIFQSLTLPDTLIPEEYHIVKNKGVMGLEFNEDDYATQVGNEI